MELRSEARVAVNCEVQAKLLREPPETWTARLVDISGRGVGLALPRAVQLENEVRIEWGQTVLVGQVCYCREHEGFFHVGMRLKKAIYHSAELAILTRRLWRESQTSIPAAAR